MSRLVHGVPIVIAVLAALLAAPAVSAQTEPPPAAIEQYIEQIPTSQGSRPAGVGKDRKRPLPAVVQKRLGQEGGVYAETLERLATDPTVGAPARKLPRPRRYAQREEARTNPDVSRALSAAVDAAGSGSDARIIGLVVALVAITLLLGAFALIQRRGAE